MVEESDVRCRLEVLVELETNSICFDHDHDSFVPPLVARVASLDLDLVATKDRRTFLCQSWNVQAVEWQDVSVQSKERADKNAYKKRFPDVDLRVVFSMSYRRMSILRR